MKVVNTPQPLSFLYEENFPSIWCYEKFFEVEHPDTKNRKKYFFHELKSVRIKIVTAWGFSTFSRSAYALYTALGGDQNYYSLLIISSSGTPWEYNLKFRPKGICHKYIRALDSKISKLKQK